MHGISCWRGRFLFTGMTLLVVTPGGCGITGRPQAGTTSSSDTLFSTVAGEDYGYEIVVAKSDDTAGEWTFALKSRRPPKDNNLRFEWEIDGQAYQGLAVSHIFSETGTFVISVRAIEPNGNDVFVLTLEIQIELPPPPNQAPVAVALAVSKDGRVVVRDGGEGERVLAVYENEQVFLDGSESYDPDGDDTSFEWAQVTGNAIHLVQLVDASAAVASFVAPTVDGDARLAFTLIVSDEQRSTEVIVPVDVLNIVEIVGAGPEADAGDPQEVTELSMVTLNGTRSSSSEGGVLSFEWFQLSGPSVTLSNAINAITTFQAPGVADGETASLIFELVVTEGDVSASDDVMITVEPDPGEPPPPPPPDCASDAECDDGVVCTVDSCNEVTHSCDNVPDNASCDNGLFCDGPEVCNPVLGCQDGDDACPAQLCHEDTDTCEDIICAGDADCDDNLVCNGAETCVSSICRPGVPVNCDDGVACTVDSCNEATDSCDNAPNDSLCDNGLFCDGSETCDPVLGCQAGSDPCPGEGCDEAGQTCVPPALSVNPQILDFGSTATDLMFEVWNSGGATLYYTIAVTDGAEWLAVPEPDPPDGESSGEHDTLTAEVDRLGLTDGTYEGAITVTPIEFGTIVTVLVALCVGPCEDLPTPVIVASRTEGTAPFAVFFEATDSTDTQGRSINSDGLLGNDIVEYTWDFGAGSEGDVGGRYFSGFNGAHVYETPGEYTVTLTIRDASGVASITETITAQPFSGTTFCFSNTADFTRCPDGATHVTTGSYDDALSYIGSDRKLLLHEGHTFTYASSAVIGASNLIIASFGDTESGARPVIQYAGTEGGVSTAPIRAVHANAVSVVDLDFQLESTVNFSRPHAFSVFGAQDILVLRCRFEGYHSSDDFADGLFVVDSQLIDAELVNMYYKGTRLAILNSELGPADASHNLYGSVIDRGVIHGNYFHEPNSTRVNLRIAANLATSRNVLVSDNTFDGSNTWLAVQFSITSGGWDETQHCENLLFERNTVTSHGIAVQQRGDYQNTLIRNNVIEAESAFEIWDHPEIPDESDGPRGLWFHHNTISSNGAVWYTNRAPDPQEVYLWQNVVNGNIEEGTSPPGLPEP